jgi:hypothetical protein
LLLDFIVYFHVGIGYITAGQGDGHGNSRSGNSRGN